MSTITFAVLALSLPVTIYARGLYFPSSTMSEERCTWERRGEQLELMAVSDACNSSEEKVEVLNLDCMDWVWTGRIYGWFPDIFELRMARRECHIRKWQPVLAAATGEQTATVPTETEVPSSPTEPPVDAEDEEGMTTPVTPVAEEPPREHGEDLVPSPQPSLPVAPPDSDLGDESDDEDDTDDDDEDGHAGSGQNTEADDSKGGSSVPLELRGRTLSNAFTSSSSGGKSPLSLSVATIGSFGSMVIAFCVL